MPAQARIHVLRERAPTPWPQHSLRRCSRFANLPSLNPARSRPTASPRALSPMKGVRHDQRCTMDLGDLLPIRDDKFERTYMSAPRANPRSLFGRIVGATHPNREPEGMPPKCVTPFFLSGFGVRRRPRRDSRAVDTADPPKPIRGLAAKIPAALAAIILSRLDQADDAAAARAKDFSRNRKLPPHRARGDVC